jgi:hypothetical protein
MTIPWPASKRRLAGQDGTTSVEVHDLSDLRGSGQHEPGVCAEPGELVGISVGQAFLRSYP